MRPWLLLLLLLLLLGSTPLALDVGVIDVRHRVTVGVDGGLMKEGVGVIRCDAGPFPATVLTHGRQPAPPEVGVREQ